MAGETAIPCGHNPRDLVPASAKADVACKVDGQGLEFIVWQKDAR
jgi:hypothetical protein